MVYRFACRDNTISCILTNWLVHSCGTYTTTNVIGKNKKSLKAKFEIWKGFQVQRKF